MRHQREQDERYGYLFNCLVTRVVYLEVAFSFIMRLRQVVARRCKPTVIYFDSATHLVGANRELWESIDDWNQDKIGTTLSQEGIEWVFNPLPARLTGGVWERIVTEIVQESPY